MYFKDFSRQLLRFSPELFRTNEMAAESDVRKMPTVVMTGLPRSIAKKGPLQKKEASLLTFSITSLTKALVFLSKFTERQLVVIKTRNKPGKKKHFVHITLSRHFVFAKGPGRPELDLNFCLVSRSPKVNSKPLINIFHRSIDMVHTTSDKQISRTFQAFFKDKLKFLGLRFMK